MASLLGIAYKQYRKGPMLELEAATLSTTEGLVGDHRGKPGKRQITVMSLEDWQTACEELGVTMEWTGRRANLLVDSLPLYQSQGRHMRIGEVILEITGETDPCSRMEEVQQGLFQALQPQWRGGVTCRVIQGGSIACGDDVELIECV